MAERPPGRPGWRRMKPPYLPPLQHSPARCASCSLCRQHLAQKLFFLDSLCTFCVDSTLQGVLRFFQEELIRTIQWLLQEEPIDRLDTAVRQQAMLAIAGMRLNMVSWLNFGPTEMFKSFLSKDLSGQLDALAELPNISFCTERT